MRLAQERDGYPVDIECLFLTDGASPGVHRIIQLMTRSESDAFLTPVPQYPLYSASLALYGTTLTPYYLDESINWGLNMEHLQEQYDKVRTESWSGRSLLSIRCNISSRRHLRRWSV